MEAEAEFLMLEEPGMILTGVSGKSGAPRAPGMMLTGVSWGSGAPWAPLCQASDLQNSKQFLFPEIASLWYIIAATSGSQQILLKMTGASAPLRRRQKI